MLDTSPVYFVLYALTRESRCFLVFFWNRASHTWHGRINCPEKKTNNKDFYRRPLIFFCSSTLVKSYWNTGMFQFLLYIVQYDREKRCYIIPLMISFNIEVFNYFKALILKKYGLLVNCWWSIGYYNVLWHWFINNQRTLLIAIR